ncbi:HAD family hydrolase [Novacetimonas pomaceti]|uniref:Phosphatase n=1 Tax=Novacetimonas pomaceti TaxID=2021998 RepID=A0A318QN17_9PROT|nr:HAD family phosphatase [Novacetimonas pomaceti]MBV1834766.1 HAD family phosphatase [Novacetimonas pomaceti]PYD48782.1 phosphatase [Novacetimonas pomaceti]PYD76619.1 phosphatase [Novacetimonas pomaceti]
MSIVPPGMKALIFDCDGTLVDTLPLYLRAWLATLEEVTRQPVPREWFYGHGGMSEHMVLDIVEDRLGRRVDRERIITTARASLHDLLEELEEISAVAAIARQYHRRLPMAVASNGSRQIVRASLSRVGLDHLFDAMLTIDDVQHGKPAPDLFLAAAKRLGVAPEHCFVFEDSREGMAAARNAGMAYVDVATLLA